MPENEYGRLDGEAPESGSQVTMRPWARPSAHKNPGPWGSAWNRTTLVTNNREVDSDRDVATEGGSTGRDGRFALARPVPCPSVAEIDQPMACRIGERYCAERPHTEKKRIRERPE